MSTFGKRLRATRKRNELSQIGLARRAGVRVATVCTIESGRGNPTEAMMEKLAWAVGSTVSHLTRGDEPPATEALTIAAVLELRAACKAASLELGSFLGACSEQEITDSFSGMAVASDLCDAAIAKTEPPQGGPHGR